MVSDSPFASLVELLLARAAERPGRQAYLFLADGAPCPANADKNPTLTIMANAWRVGDHMIDRLRRREM